MFNTKFKSGKFRWSAVSKLLGCILGMYCLFVSLSSRQTKVQAQAPQNLRYDQIQQRSIHNAYQTQFSFGSPGKAEQLLDQIIYQRAYSLEVDLFANPTPFSCSASVGPDWWIRHDAASQDSNICTLSDVLRLLRGLHDAQPQHEVITLNVELANGRIGKGSLSVFSNYSPQSLDQIFRDYLGNAIYTPAQLLRDNCMPVNTGSLTKAVLQRADGRGGWPTTDQLRGKFIITFHGADGRNRDLDDLGRFFPKNATNTGYDLPTINNRVAFLLDEFRWNEYTPQQLIDFHPHIVFHAEIPASKIYTARRNLPGHILRTNESDAPEDIAKAQKDGANLLMVNIVDTDAYPFARTHNAYLYPFGASVPDANGNYPVGAACYMHPSVANKAEPGYRMRFGDRSGGDIDNGADKFSFAYFDETSSTGNTTDVWTAEISSVSSGRVHEFGKGLIMARESLDPNARYFSIGRTADEHGLRVQWRDQFGADRVLREPNVSYRENWNFIKMELTHFNNGQNTLCRGYVSYTGAEGTWIKVGEDVTIYAPLKFKGLAVASNSNGGRYSAFDFINLRRGPVGSARQPVSLGNFQFKTINHTLTPLVQRIVASETPAPPVSGDCHVPTTITITGTTPNPSNLNGAVTINYIIGVPPAATTPLTGSVTVYAGDATCTKPISGMPPGLIYGSCQVSYAYGGPKAVVANYSGDETYGFSSSQVWSHHVNRNVTTTTLTSTNPAPALQPLTFNIAVAGTGAPAQPTGNARLTFENGLEFDVPINNGAGKYVMQNPQPGTQTVHVDYQGDGYYEPSQTTITQTVNCPTINIGPDTLATGTVMAPYTQTVTATGLLPGNRGFYIEGINFLPPGLQLGPIDGIITGTPQAVGNYAFPIGVSDFNGDCRAYRNYTLNITCPTITLASLPNARLGQTYNQAATASPTGGEYVYSVTAGSLPQGLTLNTATGAVSGTPTQTGTFNFTIKATGFKAVTGPPDEGGTFPMMNGACNGNRAYSLAVNAAGDPSGLQFYPLAHPIRLLDTRAGQTGCDAPGAMIQGGTSRTQTAAGRMCGGLLIPANAAALTGNITTVQSGGGYLTLYPSGAQRPLVANSNFSANQVLNNAFTVGLGTDGAFNIFVASSTNVVVDVTGYYAPPSDYGLYFHPLPKPVRLLETRQGQSGCNVTGVQVQGGFDQAQLAHTMCNNLTIPASATAIVGNAISLNSGTGYLTLYPQGASRPLVASSNFQTGQVMNAPFTVGLGATGEFMIFSSATTDLVIDVVGYYSDQANDENGVGLLFYPLSAPVRLLETRAGQSGCYTPGTPLTAGSTVQQQARGTCSGQTISQTALAIVGNATVVSPASNGSLIFWPSGTRPLAATSNFTAGQVFNRHFTTALAATGMFNIFSSAQTELVLDVAGYFAP